MPLDCAAAVARWIRQSRHSRFAAWRVQELQEQEELAELGSLAKQAWVVLDAMAAEDPRWAPAAAAVRHTNTAVPDDPVERAAHLIRSAVLDAELAAHNEVGGETAIQRGAAALEAIAARFLIRADQAQPAAPPQCRQRRDLAGLGGLRGAFSGSGPVSAAAPAPEPEAPGAAAAPEGPRLPPLPLDAALEGDMVRLTDFGRCVGCAIRDAAIILNHVHVGRFLSHLRSWSEAQAARCGHPGPTTWYAGAQELVTNLSPEQQGLRCFFNWDELEAVARVTRPDGLFELAELRRAGIVAVESAIISAHTVLEGAGEYSCVLWGLVDVSAAAHIVVQEHRAADWFQGMTLECSKQLRPYVEERVHDEMADLTMRWVMGELHE